jgi:succinoglycan biosynthesis protein ExoA
LSQHPLVSVCIVAGRHGPVLEACLVSLQAQRDAPPWELLVCANADSKVATTVRAHFPDAVIVHADKKLPGAARNAVVPHARGSLLFFLDDDIVAPQTLLRRLADLAAEHPEVGVFGGPNLTPPGSTRFQVVQGAVLASAIATGPVRRRYGDHPAGMADERSFILCNLAVRREVMVPFDDDLVCAEENAVLIELHRQNLSMLYDPGLAVYHERRAHYRGFARQMFKYGRGRGQVMTRDHDGIRPVFLLAPALLGYLIVSPLLALLTPWALIPLALYALAVLGGAAFVAVARRHATDFPLAVLLIVSVHLCYGAGIFAGAIRRRRRVAHPESAHPESRRTVRAESLVDVADRAGT